VDRTPLRTEVPISILTLPRLTSVGRLAPRCISNRRAGRGICAAESLTPAFVIMGVGSIYAESILLFTEIIDLTMPNSWFQPTPGDAEPSFVSSDGTRSTYDLVETCIVTLLLCSWTSIHLDIPGGKDRGSYRRAIWQKVQWTATGILFPELILWMAFAEFWEARCLCFELAKLKELNERREGGVESQATITVNEIKSEITVIETSTATEVNCNKCGSSKCTTENFTKPNNLMSIPSLVPMANPTPESTLSRVRRQMKELRKHKKLFKLPIYPKGLEVGFFIEMGGLEIDVGKVTPSVKDPSNATNGSPETCSLEQEGKVTLPMENEDPPNTIRGRVTSAGALFLAEVGLLPDIDVAQVKDKSKADLLTKVLVCFQASWMVVQCIVRDLTRLPISLLELSTVMHVMCALLIYGMWFKKPQDVGVPKRISPAKATKGLTCHQINQLKGLVESLDQSGSIQLSHSTKTDIAEVSIFIGAILGLIASGVYGGVHLTVWNGHFPTRLERALWRISSCFIVGMPAFLVIFLLLLKLVRDAAKGMKGFGRWEVTVADGWIYTSRSDLAESAQSANTRVHPKTSWNLYKPHSKFIGDLIEGEKWVMFTIYIVLVTLQTVATILYLSARAYVVVEAFLSLRSLPKGVYTKIQWVEMIPHV